MSTQYSPRPPPPMGMPLMTVTLMVAGGSLEATFSSYCAPVSRSNSFSQVVVRSAGPPPPL